MTDRSSASDPFDAVTTPAGVTTKCPQCGVTLDALTTACARCGAVITGGGHDGERAERVRQRLQAQIGDAYQLGALIGRGVLASQAPRKRLEARVHLLLGHTRT